MDAKTGLNGLMLNKNSFLQTICKSRLDSFQLQSLQHPMVEGSLSFLGEKDKHEEGPEMA
jgi:hypothetical protein